MTPALICSICGRRAFAEKQIIWPALAAEWQLSPSEVAYIDRQQGCHCVACGASLRIVALGNAIRDSLGTTLALRDAIAGKSMDHLRILDCNGAEALSRELSALPGYVRVDYPECDMRQLPFADGSFDLVVHSDTLEHIEHPVVALRECRRILAFGARLCFTVPIVVGRLSRDRAGLAPSFHGDPDMDRADFIVRTEFGADAWRIVFEAGFSNLALAQVNYPAAIAITAWDIAPPATSPTASDSDADPGSGNEPTSNVRNGT